MNFNYCPSCGHKGTVKKQDNTNYECRDCGWHFWNNAKTCTAIAFVRDGKLLVAKRDREPNKGKYELPGGFVDYGETVYEAAIREIKEELGIQLTKNDLQVVEIYYNDYNPGIFTTDIVFLVTDWAGEPMAGDDVAAILWKPLDFIYDSNFCQKYYDGLDKTIVARLAQ